MMELRYYIAERGEIPAGYILLGDAGLREGFLPAPSPARLEIVEFDEGTGFSFRFRVPGDYRFARKEGRVDLFYFLEPRDFDIPGLEISVERIDERVDRLRAASTRAAWVEEVRYGLARERVEKAGRGLLSLDIPIALPKSIERIIGRGEATSLTVQGSERIAISGTSSWCSNCPRTEGQPRQEKFPDLDLDQQLSVSLRGTIGEKINVEIQHSSVGQGVPATNRVRINYRGFDDDVIKLIEMGDTDLSLQGAQLVSYSGAAKGLFGVKAMAQAGPLDLTVIASKEEGESVSGSYSRSGGQSSTIEIRDVDFVKRQFFYFENPGPDLANPRSGFLGIYGVYGSVNPLFPVVGGASGDSLEVFMSLIGDEYRGESDQYRVNGYIDRLNNGLDDDAIVFEAVPCRQLYEKTDYELIRVYGLEGDPKYVAIRLNRPLDGTRNLLVRYRAQNINGNVVHVVGDYGEWRKDREPFKAEIICRDANNSVGTDDTWHLMMRNVYSVGSIGREATIDVRIEDLQNRDNRDIHPQSKVPYIRLFGLDQYNQVGVRARDGRFDAAVPGILDRSAGYLMIPWYRPFDPDSAFIASFLDPADPAEAAFSYATLVRDTSVYKRIVTGTELDRNHNYKIIVETTSGRRTIQLAAYDIIEGSEVVTVNGSRLVRGVDYDIDYISGEVTIKADTPPDSRINIDYQYKPLIGGGTNSLLGVGGNLNFSQNARLSGVFLYSSMGASKYAPRVGEEPSRTMAADVNGSFLLSPKWMTSVANLLPRVDTNARSSLNLTGEVAMSFPNPNVKGEAIIDDMEGVAETNQVSMLRRTWYPASLPYGRDGVQRADTSRVENFFYYNAARTPQQEYFITSRRDLNPDLDPRENATVTTLFFDAVYPTAPKPRQWCGVMTSFPNSIDLSTAQYLDIWVNDFQTDPFARGGTVHIDFGRIDEDFYKPSPDSNFPDDEKKTEYPWTIAEDVGFDAGDAGCSYPAVFDETTWIDSFFVYRGINCRKGNQVRDTEDLNGNLILDRENAYYTVSINLADTALIDIRRDFPPDDPQGRWNEYWREKNLNVRKAWRKYRIDLSKAAVFNYAPPLETIQYARIWIENPDSLVAFSKARLVEFAEFQFVGSRWQFDGVRDLGGAEIPAGAVDPDQKLVLGTINNKEDPTRYVPPYNVMQEDGITNREQSLTLSYEGVADSTGFRIVKRFFGEGQNYQQYEDFQFFVFPYSSADSVGFYLQIATDENNYYEIETAIAPADQGRWRWVNVKFSALTNLKIRGTDGIVEEFIRDSVDPNRVYAARVRGTPSLHRVRYYYAGIRNRSGRRIDRGEMWFNDIRVGGVRRDIDHAERFNAAADFAGILQLVGGWQRTGAEFRSLRASRGDGYTTSSYFLNGKTELNHLIPTARFTLPATFSLLRSNSLPKYIPNSDIEIVDPAARDSLKNRSETFGFTVGLSRRGSTNFIMKNLFDNLRGNFGYSRKQTVTHAIRDTTTTMSGSVGYQLQFRKARELALFGGTKWRYWLSSLTYEGSAGTTYSRSYTLTGGELVMRPAARTGALTNNVTALYEPFQSVKINFAMNAKRDLASKNEWRGIPIGFESAWGHSFNLNYQPGPNVFLLSRFNPRFEYRSRYSEDLNPNLRQTRETRKDTIITYPPAGPPDTSIVDVVVRDPEGTRGVSASRDIAVTLDFDVGGYVNRLGQALGLVEKGRDERTLPRAAAAPGRSKKADEFQKRLEAQMQQQQQPPPGAAPGTIEAIGEHEDAPPGREAAAVPAVPPTSPPAERTEERRGGAADLGVSRPRGGDLPSTALPADTAGASPADTASAKPDTAPERSYDPLLPVKKAFRLLGSVEPIRANIAMNHSSRYDRLYERSSALYQLGLTDGAGVAGPNGPRESRPLEARDNLSVDMSSRMPITQDIGLDVKARFTVADSDRQGKRSTTKQYTWPSVNVNWRGMEKIGLIGRYANRSDLAVGFDRRTTSDAAGGQVFYSIAPNWNLEWKNKLTSNLAVTYKRTETVRNDRESWESSYGVSVNLKYDIEGKKGLGLPLPFIGDKRLNFKSTLTTNLAVAYASSVAFNRPRGSSINVAPSMSYRFSNTIMGSVGINYNRNWGGQYGYVYQQLGVRVEAEFKF